MEGGLFDADILGIATNEASTYPMSENERGAFWG